MAGSRPTCAISLPELLPNRKVERAWSGELDVRYRPEADLTATASLGSKRFRKRIQHPVAG